MEKAEQIYLQNSKMALSSGENRFYHTIQKELALVYTNSGRFDQSLAILKSLPFSPQISLLIGQNYLSLNKLDSAHYYLEKGLNTNNLYVRKSIYAALYKLSDSPQYHKIHESLL